MKLTTLTTCNQLDVSRGDVIATTSENGAHSAMVVRVLDSSTLVVTDKWWHKLWIRTTLWLERKWIIWKVRA